MSKPVLTCWGGVGAVTGANFMLEVPRSGSGQAGMKVLVDCGLLQGLPGADAVNAEKFDYDPSSIDALFITHAHIDHIGKIPKLVKDGFKGTVYSTEETKEISVLMLLDMAKIASGNEAKRGIPAIYDAGDVERALQQWEALPYHAPKEFGDPSQTGQGFTVELFNAGHILGSAMYKFTFSNGSIMFTGDTGSEAAPLEPDIDEVSGLSYLLMDSVYGDRNHQSGPERDKEFRDAVVEAATQGKTMLIPAFSLERTQVLLYELHKIFASGAAPKVPVFLDSPLAIKVTEIYERFKKDYNPAVEKEIDAGTDVFKFPKLSETSDFRDSREIGLVHGGKIIMAGSGMSTAGRILGHEETYLPDPNAILLFVGYQAPGTLGRVIQSGERQVMINGVKVEIKAKVVTVDGFSAHRDSDGLVEFVSHTAKTLKQVFVTMGEPKSSIYLAQRLHDELGVDTVVPERGKQYELDL